MSDISAQERRNAKLNPFFVEDKTPPRAEHGKQQQQTNNLKNFSRSKTDHQQLQGNAKLNPFFVEESPVQQSNQDGYSRSIP